MSTAETIQDVRFLNELKLQLFLVFYKWIGNIPHLLEILVNPSSPNEIRAEAFETILKLRDQEPTEFSHIIVSVQQGYVINQRAIDSSGTMHSISDIGGQNSHSVSDVAFINFDEQSRARMARSLYEIVAYLKQVESNLDGKPFDPRLEPYFLGYMSQFVAAIPNLIDQISIGGSVINLPKKERENTTTIPWDLEDLDTFFKNKFGWLYTHQEPESAQTIKSNPWFGYFPH